eukprot:gene13613-16020_t
MKSIQLIIVLLCLATVALCQVPSDDELQEAFKNWSEVYETKYTSGEFLIAFQNWKDNVFAIAALTSEITVPDVELVYPDVSQSNIRALYDVATTPVITYPSGDVAKFSVNQFSDISYSDFLHTYTGAQPSADVLAASTLSVGAIAGIAIASVVVVGASAGTVVAIKRRRDKKPSDVPMSTVSTSPRAQGSLGPASGIDILNFDPSNPHRSITARAQPTN